MTEISVGVAGYHNADKCMEFLVQKTNFSTKNRTYTYVAAFYTTNRYSKIITNDSLWIFFIKKKKKKSIHRISNLLEWFFFNRKKKSIQSIEFARILTRDKYLIHVSFLTNPMFLCTRPKQIPRSALHIVYNSCICMCVYDTQSQIACKQTTMSKILKLKG